MPALTTALALACLAVFVVLGSLFFFPSVGGKRAIYPEKRLEILRNHPAIGWLWLVSGCLPMLFGLWPAPGRSVSGHLLIAFGSVGLFGFCVSRVFPRLEKPAWRLCLACFGMVVILAILDKAG